MVNRLSSVLEKIRSDESARKIFNMIEARHKMLPKGGDLDIFELCKEIPNVDVDVVPYMPRKITGAIFRKKNGCYAVYVNGKLTPSRQCFVAAHELAHFLLHREHLDAHGEIMDKFLFRSELSHEDELDANRLALWILLPDGV